ncbi:MAG: hypothetical protein GX758_05140 [Tenericutes bacterium]|nr:hypothetical protein [Mycoplasmatota bacterium]
MKSLFYSDVNFPQTLEIKKIGITLRRLNPEEEETILKLVLDAFASINENNEYNEYIKHKNGEINDIEQEYNILKQVDRMDDFRKSILFWKYAREEKFYLDEDNIKKALLKIVLVEVDSEKIRKYFGDDYEAFIISKLLNFSNYLNLENADFEYKTMPIIRFSDFVKKEEHPYFLTLFDDVNSLYNDYNYEKLSRTVNFLNKHDSEFNFNFISIIDTLLVESNLPENELLNMVSVLERILINKDDPKSKSFVLKSVLLCDGRLVGKNKNKIIDQLKAIYEIRSAVIHGNEKILNSKIKHYETVFDQELEFKSDSRYLARRMFFVVINLFVQGYLVEIMNKYLDDPELIEKIKKS